MIFLAAALGTLISLPLLAAHRLKPTSKVPFGPFLILAAFVALLWGQAVLDWYQRTFLSYS
jgi:prepilin signal peptidase PulO-like enzyme (type II secretory pathway)